MDKVTPGARLLVLGPRRSGKTTLLRHLPDLLKGAHSVHSVGAFSATTGNALERLSVYCLAPRHQLHRIALIDDVECFAASDVTNIRKLIRSHMDITFVMTTSTVAGLQEPLVAQCNVMQLVMPRAEDLRRLGGAGCTPAPGMSVAAARNQQRVCELVGRRVSWRERCEAPDIVAAVGHPDGLADALDETDRLILNGWSCGDLIETLHTALVRGQWPDSMALGIATVLLRYSTHADRPDSYTAMAYLMAIDLASVGIKQPPCAPAPQAMCFPPES